MSEHECHLYRFYDHSGDLLYVGITRELQKRWATHARKKPWWPEVARKTVETFPSRQDAMAAELEAIRFENPVYNVLGRPARDVEAAQLRARRKEAGWKSRDTRLARTVARSAPEAANSASVAVCDVLPIDPDADRVRELESRLGDLNAEAARLAAERERVELELAELNRLLEWQDAEIAWLRSEIVRKSREYGIPVGDEAVESGVVFVAGGSGVLVSA